MRLPTAFAKICELATALGARDIGNLPGCWYHRIDDKWEVAVNGHEVPTPCAEYGERPIAPGTAYLRCNEWPAAFLDPKGGCLIGGTEDELLAVLDAAIERTKVTT
jgi:hypothetical protein